MGPRSNREHIRKSAQRFSSRSCFNQKPGGCPLARGGGKQTDRGFAFCRSFGNPLGESSCQGVREIAFSAGVRVFGRRFAAPVRLTSVALDVPMPWRSAALKGGSSAQQARRSAFAATIASFDGPVLAIKTREGEGREGPADRQRRGVRRGQTSLSEIKEGSYIGVSAMPQSDGTQRRWPCTFSPRTNAAPRRLPSWILRAQFPHLTKATGAETVKGTDCREHLCQVQGTARRKSGCRRIRRSVTFVAGDSPE